MGKGAPGSTGATGYARYQVQVPLCYRGERTSESESLELYDYGPQSIPAPPTARAAFGWVEKMRTRGRLAPGPHAPPARRWLLLMDFLACFASRFGLARCDGSQPCAHAKPVEALQA
jgi:hypothetical protein